MAAKLGGLKGGKYTIGQNADINVTPFVDVMLVLLIIFMVSAPLATVAIKIDLPPAVPSPDNGKKPVYISMREDGNIYIVDKITTLPTLQADLQRAFSETDPRHESILIRADRLVRYSSFMSVVNQLQTDGFYKVALINEDLSAVS